MNENNNIALVDEEVNIVKYDTEHLASEIFSLTCSALIYKRKKGLKEINIYQIYEEYEKTIFDKLI